MLVVVALGGNALLRRGQAADVAIQRANATAAVEAVAGLADEHDVVVAHGNDPQVGLLALQDEAYRAVAPYPLDVLGAESEGMIGYLLDQELVNRLGGARQVATLLTQVIVDADDPAFARPDAVHRPGLRARPRPSGWQPSGAGPSRPTGASGGASFRRRSRARSSSWTRSGCSSKPACSWSASAAAASPSSSIATGACAASRP